MNGLTDRQREALDFIGTFTRERGFPPTLREIGRAMGIASTNAVSDHLRALQRKGAVTWEPRMSRTVRCVENQKSAP